MRTSYVKPPWGLHLLAAGRVVAASAADAAEIALACLMSSRSRKLPCFWLAPREGRAVPGFTSCILYVAKVQPGTSGF